MNNIGEVSVLAYLAVASIICFVIGSFFEKENDIWTLGGDRQPSIGVLLVYSGDLQMNTTIVIFAIGWIAMMLALGTKREWLFHTLIFGGILLWIIACFV